MILVSTNLIAFYELKASISNASISILLFIHSDTWIYQNLAWEKLISYFQEY
jgi:hypothetical protein